MEELSYPELYKRLRASFGHLGWWPGETRDEIVIGAILTQQTSWKNVERAIDGLRSEGLVDLKRISATNVKVIERAIRPSGFYRQKARRLKGIATYLCRNYGTLDRLFRKDAIALRKELLSLNGIGKETADSIILYAAEKPIFVIDAYTRRIMSRAYGTDPEIDYDALQVMITSGIRKNLGLYKDFHAQFVELGKANCRTRPICAGCPISEYCRYFAHAIGTRQEA